ncbi:MAG: hypothetical protein ACE5OZ_15235 [Candidatus Heimdallarchaeota archaeon]
MDTMDLAEENLLLFTNTKSNPSPEEILRFDRCRRVFKERLSNLDDPKKTAAFEPIMRWMHLFVSTMAPELLADELAEEI